MTEREPLGRIILVLMSGIEDSVLAVLKKGLEHAFNRRVEVCAKIGKLERAYDAGRRQYQSPQLLSRLRSIKKDCGDKIVGLVDVDLYSPGFDYVFGEADVTAGVATVSIHRLRPEFYH